MKTIRISKNLSMLAALGCLSLAAGCSDDENDDASSDSGGSSATGGSSASGGSTSTGGSSGSSAQGGSAGQGGSTSGGAGTGGSMVESARVRVLHVSPDAPGVDVFANGGEEPVVEDLEFPNGTPYLEVPEGTYTFDVAPAGGSADDAVLTIEDIELEAGGSYTAVAFDELDSISALALVDDYDDLDAGNIRIRAIHAAVGVGEVDIWDVTNPARPAALYEDVDFGVAGDALDVPAGAYSVGIDVDDDASPDLTFDLPALDPGTVVNLYAVSAEGDVFLIAQLPDGTTARIDPRGPTAFIRVLHLSPDAPAVDVFVNQGSDPAVSELAFPNGTAYLALPADTYDIDVAPAGSSADDSVLSIADLALAEDTFYTAVAIDEVANLTALALVDDYSDLDSGQIRVRAVHAAPAVGQVDLWNVPESGAPSPLWTDVDFGVAGNALDLDEGAYTIGVDVDNDMTPDLIFVLPELSAGTVANVFATNDEDDNVFLIAQLADGPTVRIDPE